MWSKTKKKLSRYVLHRAAAAARNTNNQQEVGAAFVLNWDDTTKVAQQ